MENETIAVVLGGDLRQCYAAEYLAKKGYCVYGLGFGQEVLVKQVKLTEDASVLKQAKLALFPLGVSKVENWESYLSALPKDCMLFGGNVTEQEQAIAEGLGLYFRDFFKVEELTVVNALLTAEGAIQAAMEQLPIALWHSRCLIGGYGRIGRALHSRLKAFGAEVTILARKPEQRIWAEVEGAKALDFSQASEILPHQQLIFNTVPSVWLREQLPFLPDDCPVIELASKPYGVDFAMAEQLGKQAVLAAGLPGKYAPQTAGELIAQTILTMR